MMPSGLPSDFTCCICRRLRRWRNNRSNFVHFSLPDCPTATDSLLPACLPARPPAYSPACLRRVVACLIDRSLSLYPIHLENNQASGGGDRVSERVARRRRRHRRFPAVYPSPAEGAIPHRALRLAEDAGDRLIGPPPPGLCAGRASNRESWRPRPATCRLYRRGRGRCRSLESRLWRRSGITISGADVA